MFRLATFCGFGALLVAWMAFSSVSIGASTKGTGTGSSTGKGGKGTGIGGTGMGGSHPAGKGGKSTGGSGTGGTSTGTGYPSVGGTGTVAPPPSPFSIPPLTADPKSDNKPAIEKPSIAAKPLTSTGKVQALSSDNKELTILDKDGKEQKFKLDASAKIKLNDKDAEVGDIRDKDDATITFEKKDDTLIAKEVILKRK